MQDSPSLDTASGARLRALAATLPALVLFASCGPGARPGSRVARGETCPGHSASDPRIGVIVAGTNAYFEEHSVGTMEDAAGLSFEGVPGYVLFFFPDPEQGSGAFVPVGHAGGAQSLMSFGDVTLATGKTLPALGIKDRSALVSFELNCGMSVAGMTAVMTWMKRLDGTPAYPLHVHDVIDGAMAEAEKRFQARKPEIEAGIAALRETAFMTKQPGEPGSSALPIAYWKDDRLIVTIRMRATETERAWGCGPPTVEPCFAISARITAELTVTVTADRRGKVVSIEESQLTFKSEGFPPPM